MKRTSERKVGSRPDIISETNAIREHCVERGRRIGYGSGRRRSHCFQGKHLNRFRRVGTEAFGDGV